MYRPTLIPSTALWPPAVPGWATRRGLVTDTAEAAFLAGAALAAVDRLVLGARGGRLDALRMPAGSWAAARTRRRCAMPGICARLMTIWGRLATCFGPFGNLRRGRSRSTRKACPWWSKGSACAGLLSRRALFAWYLMGGASFDPVEDLPAQRLIEKSVDPRRSFRRVSQDGMTWA